MRAAEARSGLPDDGAELMERAGAQAARGALELLRRGASAGRSSAAAARTAATGGSPRVISRRRAATCASSTRRRATTDLGEPDVIVDALFGTGFSRRAARRARPR